MAAMDLTADDDGSVGLAKRLKEGTAAAHQAAEKARFVHEFIKGKIVREAYCQFLIDLQVVYESLEQQLDKNWEHELLEPLYFPDELCRSQALAADIRFFCGEKKYQPTASALRYAERLREIGDTQPELLISHAYTRYLGDLSGGAFLKRALLRAFKLSKDDGKGSQFYIFRHIKDVKEFKNMYRARLDSLPASDEVAASMVEEANRAFELNMELFMELEKYLDPPDQDVHPVGDVEVSSTKSCNGKCAACPFAHLAAAGAPMPKGHESFVSKGHSSPKLKVQIDDALTTKDCPLSWSCPLKQLGKQAPRVALFVLPVAFTLLQTTSMSTFNMLQLVA